MKQERQLDVSVYQLRVSEKPRDLNVCVILH